MRRHELTWEERWKIEEDARRQAIATTELALMKMRRKYEREYLLGCLIGIGLVLITKICQGRAGADR